MLPSEILIMVFSNLTLEELDTARKTCLRWKSLISNSVHLWKCMIKKHCDSKQSLKKIPEFSIYNDIVNNSEKLENFYRKLLKIENNVLSNNYRVRTIDCLEAEINGMKVEKHSEWSRNHNYKGVYDMVLDKNILVASVYDTIQVWDMSQYKMTNMLPSKLLDEPQSKTTCFTLVAEQFLVCGTQNGFLKIFSLAGEMVAKSRANSNYITDVYAHGATVASLDWYGDVTLWRVQLPGPDTAAAPQLETVSAAGQFVVPRLLAKRDCERLLYFSSDYLVTTYLTHLTCYNKSQFFRSYPAPSDIFCICIQDDKLAFGCKGDSTTPSAGILNLNPDKFPSVVFLRTRDNDPIISISFRDDTLVLGDTNGELHILRVAELQFPETGEVTVELRGEDGAAPGHGVQFVSTIRTHEYRAFIWAVKTDGYRVFSGDETGKIIVHDYLMFED